MTIEQFTTIRLWHVFKQARHRESRSFDLEWFGGLWDSDEVPGVEQYFPRRAPDKAAVLQLSAVFEWPRLVDIHSFHGWRIDDGLNANCSAMLAKLDVPIRFGESMKRLLEWAGPTSREEPSADPTLKRITFASDDGSLSYTALADDVLGLGALEIRVPELINLNDTGAG
jgi:hypothetical protein